VRARQIAGREAESVFEGTCASLDMSGEMESSEQTKSLRLRKTCSNKKATRKKISEVAARRAGGLRRGRIATDVWIGS